MSLLLDTNVVSELARTGLSPNVAGFVLEQAEDSLYVSVVTLAEIRFGIALLAEGRKRQALEHWFDAELPQRFTQRILDVTPEVAAAWGDLMARSQRRGLDLQAMDGLIAATARAHGMTLVTRNIRDFAGLDLPLIDPWTER